MEDKLIEFEAIKKDRIRIHLGLTCMAYFFWGIGMCLALFGVKAGINGWIVISGYTFSLVFFVIIVFTSMVKVKARLFPDKK